MNHLRIPSFIVLASLACTSMAARADELEELRGLRDATLQLVDVLVKRGILTQEDAAPVVERAKRAQEAATSEPKGGNVANANANAADGHGEPADVVRVPYVPKIVRDRMRDEIRSEVLAQAKAERWGDPGALPDWLSRFTFAGDFRLRYQSDTFPSGGRPNASVANFQSEGQTNITNTTDTQTRLRLRARFGFEAQIAEGIQGGLRLATGGVGAGSDPNSTNQTLGNYDGRYTIGVDRAYLRYQPATWLGLTGGRIANPFFAPTDLVWNDSLSLEGLAVQSTAQADRVKVSATVGAFPIQNILPTPGSDAKSKWLYGYQGTLAWDLPAGGAVKLGLGLYDYRHVEAEPDPVGVSGTYAASQPLFRQKGNTVFNINENNPASAAVWGLASKFRELNLSGSIDLANFDPAHVVLDADLVRNLGFNRDEILARTGNDLPNQTKGYQARLTVGNLDFKQRGNWQAFLGYRYIQADAVLDALTDTDFHLGGTNAQGYFLGIRYGVAKNSYAALRWLSAKAISGFPLAIDVLQIDLNTAF